MTEKKSIATLVPISARSVGDLARKGWQHRSSRFVGGDDKDIYTSSSDDELSISWNSSPGTIDTKDINSVKNSRHVVTKLNFDDCVAKNYQIPIASVERIIKPIITSESFSVPHNEEQNDNEYTSKNYGNYSNSVLSPHLFVTNKLNYVPETPGVGMCTSKTKCFESLHPYCEKNQKSGGSESSSQEIAMQTPKRFDLENYFQVITDISPGTLENNVASSILKECNSSPVIGSSKKKLKKIPFSDKHNTILQSRSSPHYNADASAVLVPVPVTTSESDISSFKQKLNIACVTSPSKKFIEQKNVKIEKSYTDDSIVNPTSILQSPINSEKPESSEFTFSPILGSKKKRHFQKFVKSRKLRKSFVTCGPGRQNGMSVLKNKENASSDLTSEKSAIVIPLNSESTCALSSFYKELSKVKTELCWGSPETSVSSEKTYAEVNEPNGLLSQRYSSRRRVRRKLNNLSLANQFITSKIDLLQNIMLSKNEDTESTKNPLLSKEECNLKIQNELKEGNEMVASVDNISGVRNSSQALMCVASNRLSKKSVNKKLKLTKFTSNLEHSDTDSAWRQSFITQETVTFYCVNGSETITSQADKIEGSQYFDIFKASNTGNIVCIPTSIPGTQKQLMPEPQEEQIDKLLLSKNCNLGIPETVCNKTNYTISMDCSPHFCGNDVKESVENENLNVANKPIIIDAENNHVKENHKISSQSLFVDDVIGCSQVILESKKRNKSLKMSFVNHRMGDRFSYNSIAFQHSVSMSTDNKHTSVKKCSSSHTDSDILNTSLHIENVTSDEETELSPQKKHKIKVVAKRLTFQQKKAGSDMSPLKSKIHGTSNMVGCVEEICEISDTQKKTRVDFSPMRFVEDDKMPLKTICEPNKIHLERSKTVQDFLISGNYIISQESSPKKNSTPFKIDDSQVHITSGSSQDPEQDQHTPPRPATPLITMDSGKKRKRLKKDGLAARLQRLLTRKHASTHLCKYEVSVGTRRPGDSVLLVKGAWLEYSRLLVQCTPYPSVFQLQNHSKDLVKTTLEQQIYNTTTELQENGQSWVVVMDSSMLPVGQLKENAIIKIYAPWQTMQVPRLATTLILDVTYAELVSENSLKSPELAPTLYETDTFHCPCMDGSCTPNSCDYQMPDRGKGLSRLLFPVLHGLANMSNQVCLLQTVSEHPEVQKGTIAEAIVYHSRALFSGIWLYVKVLRIFCFRPPEAYDEPDNYFNVYNLIWSVLGEDINSELCEIILGSPCEDSVTKEWEEIISRSALGQSYKITGLNVTRRHPLQSTYGIWGFVKKDLDKNSFHENSTTSNQQMFFYVFSVTSEVWNMENKGVKDKKEVLHKLATLSDILEKLGEGSCRFTVLVKAVAFWNSNLYITDYSLMSSINAVQLPSYLRVNVKSSCHVLDEILTQVFCMQDLLLSEGALFADKYSRVFAVEEKTEAPCISVNPADITQLKHLSPHIPSLKMSSKSTELVIVTGHVVGVDEETALSWPVCKQCGRDLIEQRHHHQLLCKKCGLADPITKVSLDIILRCTNVSNKQVKIKLLQKSILSLLPGALEGSGFEVESVMNRMVGPLVCVVLEMCPLRTSKFPLYDMLLQEVHQMHEEIQWQDEQKNS